MRAGPGGGNLHDDRPAAFIHIHLDNDDIEHNLDEHDLDLDLDLDVDHHDDRAAERRWAEH
ncbi:MAG TPA: hypothetical protein PKD80_16525 [Microthrixaceae bacterium]|nr:hypothetical protein [Microthrixaceae bacterium]HMT23446.1 hypothetical protein [Microthrixaceae bacterium]HMT59478.1 hypothetical protein [Microthrixaceae bacterium]